MKETSLAAQLEELKATMARVTPEAVGRVLAPLGLVCRKLTHFTDSLGVINPIFFVQAAPPSGREDDAAEQVVELVLRVSNPHPFWRGRKTEHEVAVMEFVRAHGRPDVLPVPRVVAHSSDAAQSPLGTDFVLMEKAPGQNLKDVPSTITTSSSVVRFASLRLTSLACEWSAVAHTRCGGQERLHRAVGPDHGRAASHLRLPAQRARDSLSSPRSSAQLLTGGLVCGKDSGDWGRSTVRWSLWSSCRTDR